MNSPGEKLMQYVWQHRLWLPADMRTVSGEAVEVLDPGLLNSDAGPDFFNAKVRIGQKIWAGNVEIHVRATDWHRHGHDSDRAYDSVVLHVVDSDDGRIYRPDGEEIPQVVMNCARDFSESYRRMVNNPCSGLACGEELRSVERIYVSDWLTALAFERLYAKADRVEALIERLDGDWREAIYVTLARGLGFHTNSDAFERLALATPLSRLLHHQHNQLTVEGALFGQAGLIPEPDGGALRNEYNFMRAKYGFEAPVGLCWKMARMRPQNFPQRRIALLAAMVTRGFVISNNLLDVKTVDDATALFDVGVPLSEVSVNTLIINVVAPVLYAYGRAYGLDDKLETAVELLQSLPAESNKVIRLFEAVGVECKDAFTSQALIELRREYCEPRKCLYCRLGHRFLAAKAIRRR